MPKPTDTASTQSLIMTRRYAAPRDLVFAAISQAEHLQHWMCPEGFTVPVTEAEARVGGRFRIQMKSPEGQIFVVGGVYLLIDSPKR
ncbi:MAG TPA: SRPBCC domain-containing protein, partial [Steroidobacteraceae bacterium]|nr:SRPBCC domain-containing protein [Steroidobacteraceae bacterium]